MARIAKTAAANEAAAKAVATEAKAKVGKLDKAAKASKVAKAEKAPKAEKVAKEPSEKVARGEFANRAYKVTEAGKAANPRGNRGIRWDIVKAHKNTADILGQEFTRADGETATITSAGLRNFVDRGFIEFV